MDDGLDIEAKLNCKLLNNHKYIRLRSSPYWITLSPKRHKPLRQDLLSCCHELKVVVHQAEDLLLTDVVAAQAPQAH
tara:strand:- start:67 stop:297 length:231 start_codon:yes stop_codon:yes gene_type:complete